MGFRNPATTATAVDTGRGLANAGVRLYQDRTFPAVPQGVAEWRTGLMARNATIKLSGGASGGSAFTFDGGQTSDGTSAPTLELDVTSSPTGGYRPVARISVPWADQVARTTFTTYENPTLFAPFASPGYDDAYFSQDANGYVQCGGFVLSKTAGGYSFGTEIVRLPAGCRPKRTHYFTALSGQTATALFHLQVDPSGAVSHASTVGAVTYKTNGWIALDGIAFQAEQ